MDFTSLSDDKLSNLIQEAQREQAERRARKHAAVLASIDARLAAMRTEALEAGLDPVAVEAALAGHTGGARPSRRARAAAANGKDGRSDVKPKYWNPGDHAQRWAGRGAKPKWYEAHLAGGGTANDLLIPEGAV